MKSTFRWNHLLNQLFLLLLYSFLQNDWVSNWQKSGELSSWRPLPSHFQKQHFCVKNEIKENNCCNLLVFPPIYPCFALIYCMSFLRLLINCIFHNGLYVPISTISRRNFSVFVYLCTFHSRRLLWFGIPAKYEELWRMLDARKVKLKIMR